MSNKEWIINPYVFQRKARNFYATRILQPFLIRFFTFFERRELLKLRHQYEDLYQEFNNPLVTVTIATYNRAQLLIERAVSSAIRQTYKNIEIVIVGDGCTDETELMIKSVSDPRIRFINLPKRGNYPGQPQFRWYVAGSYPINRALSEAKGRWIAHLDDDDIFEPKHIEQMLSYAYEHKLEFVYGKRNYESQPGIWAITGEPGIISHSSVVFRTYLKLFEFKPFSWRIRLPVDVYTWWRMERAGVRMAFADYLSFHAPLRHNTSRHHFHAEDYH